ncbi:MAG: rod shape-determining protein MreD [Anaerolineales bacterium]|nr:rod shape-determining protein MreD [Anaerolineales bacterium]
MRNWIVVLLVFALTLILQLSIFSRLVLLRGSADVVLVWLATLALQERFPLGLGWGAALGLAVGLISAAPWYLYLIAYVATAGLARLLARRIWQAPLLALLLVVVAGTLFLHFLLFVYRTLFEVAFPWETFFVQISLPTLFLNLLAAVVVYPFGRDLVERFYPESV